MYVSQYLGTNYTILMGLKLRSNRLIEIVICNNCWKHWTNFLFVMYKNNIQTNTSGDSGAEEEVNFTSKN